jgi:hypothetical protein
MITGKCLCGKVRYEINARLGPVVYCHRSMCRRATGLRPVSPVQHRFRCSHDPWTCSIGPRRPSPCIGRGVEGKHQSCQRTANAIARQVISRCVSVQRERRLVIESGGVNSQMLAQQLAS